MKKVLFLIFISSLLFISCEKDFTDVVDYAVNPYHVTAISPSGNILFNAQDSLITIKMDFTSSSKVGQVSFDIFSSANVRLNQQRLFLYDNGLAEFGDNVANDNKFANKFPLSSQFPVGTYYIRYYIADQLEGDKLIAQGSFVYDNGQTNVAPVISNLVMPGTVGAGGTIVFSVDVDDQNGLEDIEFVFYEAYNPNGEKVVNSQGISKFPLFDNGDTEVNGDLVAGDGKFTVRLTFPASVQVGSWRFEFQAEDRGGLLSNKIIHTIIVQ